MGHIKWVRDGKDLRGMSNWTGGGNAMEKYPSEEDFVEIQKWCEANQCGRRMSFDIFRFKTRQDITAFLLRWS